MRDPFGLGIGWAAGVGALGSVYTATPVNFDGATYLTRDAALTGVSASKVWSFSFWYRRDAGALNFRKIFGQTGDVNTFTLFGSDLNNRLDIFGMNAGGATILNLRFTGVDGLDDEWHHVMGSLNLANSSERSAYFDEATTGLTWEVYTDDTMDFAKADTFIGVTTDLGTEYAGDMADLWLRFGGDVIDFSVEANRRMFITAEGAPANPAGWPSGGQIQLYGAVADWHTNKGTGGGFTENGALGDGTAPVALGSP